MLHRHFNKNISFWTVLRSFFLDRLISFQEDAKKFVALAKKINSEKICSQVKTSWLQLYCSFMRSIIQFQRLVHHRNKRPERFEFWFLIILYSTYFCLFCICLFSAYAVGRWNWWQSLNTISLQCPGRHLSYAGSYWRNNSSGSYEGDNILNLIPSLCMSAVHIICT